MFIFKIKHRFIKLQNLKLINTMYINIQNYHLKYKFI